MNLLFAVFAILLLAWSLKLRTRSWAHPAVVFLSFWAVTAALGSLNPLNLRPVNVTATAILLVGLASFWYGALLTIGRRPSVQTTSRERPRELGRIVVLPQHLPIVLLGAALLLLVGTLAFRSSVQDAAGRSFSGLTPQQVRYLSSYGEARHSGPGPILRATAPLVAACGIALAQKKRRYWAVVILALYATSQDPGRSLTVITVLVSLLAWFYLRSFSKTEKRTERARYGRKTLLVVLGVAVSVGFYFQHQGDSLQKSDLGIISAKRYVPAGVAPIAVYLTGSLSALSEATTRGFDPTDGRRLRSLWIVPRVLSVLFPRIQVPETVAANVYISAPFNTYTWAGDIWFDLGWTGLMCLGFGLGVLTEVLHQRVERRRTLEAIFTASVFYAILASGVLVFRLFWLDTVVMFGVGYFALTASSRKAPIRPRLLLTKS